MKKSLTLLACAFGISGAFAQDLTSKKGEPILPEAGDWSIGVEATPFLNYMGNFFGKSANNTAPTFNFLNSSQMITGKYFVDAATAYRASLRLGFGNNTVKEATSDRSYVPKNPNSFPTADPTVDNVWKHSQTNIGLAVGLEKRKGKTRLQGYYGAEVGIGLSTSKDKFEYGNALNPVSTNTAVNAVIVDVGDQISGAGNYNTAAPIEGIVGDARATERKNGTVFSVGARAFIGVEYFILPKISLGGEFGWGLGFRTGAKTSTTYEAVGNKDPFGANSKLEVGSSTIETPATGGAFGLDTDNLSGLSGFSGALRLNFHF